MISILVPAHNEESVIGRCLTAMVDGAVPGEIEVIVVANGCSDATEQIAVAFGEPVKVISVARASKSNALNVGDAAANGFPRIYVDADVVITLDLIRKLGRALETGPALAVAPAVDNVFRPETSWWVKAYYDFWMALPYVSEGMVAAGVYAVGREGRGRFAEFPEVISDDGYFRLHFSGTERVEVQQASSQVTAPTSLRDLIRIRTRSRLGALQLEKAFPALSQAHRGRTRYGGALAHILLRPRLYLGAVPYVLVQLLARRRASQQARRVEEYVWERDDSSR